MVFWVVVKEGKVDGIGIVHEVEAQVGFVLE